MYQSITITKTGSNRKGEKATLLCSVQLRGNLKYLLPYIKLEWIGPSGSLTSKDSGIKSGIQKFSYSVSSLALELGPLEAHHKGLYKCNASISMPSLIPFFQKTARYEMIVQSESNSNIYCLHVFLFPCSLPFPSLYNYIFIPPCISAASNCALYIIIFYTVLLIKCTIYLLLIIVTISVL